MELPDLATFRRVRAARLALEERAPAGTGVVWTPVTIGAVPEEMDFEESIRRRFTYSGEGERAELYGRAWAQRRASARAAAEAGEEHVDELGDAAAEVGDEAHDPVPIEDCERCQMRQRWGSGRCARCEARGAVAPPAPRRADCHDLVAILVAVVVVLTVIVWTVMSLQRGTGNDDVNRCVRIVGDAADTSGC